MFRAAYAAAIKFTKPVVLSRLAHNGACSSAIAAYVVINSDGWVVTANHVVAEIAKMDAEQQSVVDHEAKVAAINADAALPEGKKKKAIFNLGKLNKDLTTKYSYWFGLPDNRASVKKWFTIPDIDLALGKIDPFDPAWVGTFPTFKDPTKNFEPGSSLCKLGFPFHSFEPKWDNARGQFDFPPGALPIPFFPIEGLFTRTLENPTGGGPFPLRQIETSSPGLRGQSGGPTFDTDGAIWGIQSMTINLPLGFAPKVKGMGTEHQFLNVGIGVHVETLIGAFTHFGIKFQQSTH